MERIIVGIDGSESSEDALRWALREARRSGATLTAVLVWDLLDQHHPEGGTRFDADYGEADARRTLDVVVERVLGADAAEVEREVVCDLAAPGLIGAAANADLLVVGARGLEGFRGLLLGSVSQRCLDHARCPVAVVHYGEGDGDDRGRVVVGVDGSEPAQRALRWAIEEARRRVAILEVVHAWHMPYVGAYPYVGDAFDVALVEQGARELVEKSLADAGKDIGEVEHTVVRGTPTRSIIDAAEDADLIVVGARGLGGFRGLLLGSVSQQLARHADRPLVVVPADR